MTHLVAGEPERLFTGAEWTEGPLWLPDTGRVRFSDIPNDRVLEYDAATGRTDVHAEPAGFQNGRILDRQGRVVRCSHGNRRVERETGRTVEVLVDSWEGHRLNSPNDVVVARDGTVWFTDPPYGIQPSGREGYPGEMEYGGCYVFRYDETTGVLDAVVTDMDHPNGLAFSPDESVLYVADTGENSKLRAYDVEGGGCVNGRDIPTVPVGAVDGLRVDGVGNLWCSAGDGVYVLDARGRVLEHIAVPEVVSNVCFGGEQRQWLYMTATTSLYRVRLGRRVGLS
ncbi:SMP-30/gluconolactonase/LRE family protein [Phytoactinopolyspora mesophila]|uniref:SMP-30/gluconolactonase/LRE family protein n=1 Tax=Phytoactinopolyspora mesophila TaxID=2650750 RepID=A0A7K3MB59_9ACTN|nr:SMP-30/gluconolactonase/LRE family protein [Phytoactinopolyspora mesophila]NDL60534.1 SMP-30/gluconolactonase/LRE family protein [Phytoactinopolyspora mesophila]